MLYFERIKEDQTTHAPLKFKIKLIYRALIPKGILTRLSRSLRVADGRCFHAAWAVSKSVY